MIMLWVEQPSSVGVVIVPLLLCCSTSVLEHPVQDIISLHYTCMHAPTEFMQFWTELGAVQHYCHFLKSKKCFIGVGASRAVSYAGRLVHCYDVASAPLVRRPCRMIGSSPVLDWLGTLVTVFVVELSTQDLFCQEIHVNCAKSFDQPQTSCFLSD